MKIKTKDLTGDRLNWAVATCEGYTDLRKNAHRFCEVLIMTRPSEEEGPTWFVDLPYSTDWDLGGPIICREGICLDTEHGDTWRARFGRARITFDGRFHSYHHAEGPTPLIAAMRCFLSSKLGDDVEIPEELA